MISVASVQVKYEGKEVLRNLSANFASEKVYGILGLNGAGKTTFFNLLSGVVKPSAGQLQLPAQPIGYLETSNFFYPYLTGNEHLQIFEQTNPDFNLEALQTLFQLPLNSLIETYSTGMKKKLALLALLKKDCSAYLLDEPFNGLDLESNQVLEEIVKALKVKGKTILLSSHIVEPLFGVCDEILFLEEGQFNRRYEKEAFGGVKEALLGHLQARVAHIVRGAV